MQVCRSLIVVIFSLLLSSILVAQESQSAEVSPTEQVSTARLSDRLNLANTLPDYLVTPGDSYELHLLASGGVGTGLSKLELFVEEDYSVNMAFLGVVNGRGKTFPQLKREILAIVRRAYPQSSPSLILTGLGSFQVSLTGAVTASALLTVDGLTRLDEIFGPRLLSSADRRSIRIERRQSGNIQVDYFQYLRTADTASNPYLRPGDVVTIPFAERIVRISGSIKRPGTYTLVPEDNLSNLIFDYAGGYLDDADPQNASVVRNNQAQVRQYYDLSRSEILNEVQVQNLDSFSIPSVRQRTSLYYVEGALVEERTGTTIDSGSLTASGVQPWLRVRKELIPGTNLLDAVREAYSLLHQQAAISEAYLVRGAGGETIPVNMLEILLGNSGRNTVVEPFDRLVVPYRQFWVNVTGAVRAPRLIPFVEGQSVQYYVGLAGGVNIQTGTGSLELRDHEGQKREPSDLVQPMDTIHVYENRFTSTATPTLTTIGTVISIASGVVGIVAAIVELTK